MKTLLILTLLGLNLFAKEHIVDQKNKTYIPNKLTVSVGDTIVLKNSDPYFHISYSTDPINGFNTGVQKQGEIKKIEINAERSFVIQCSVHPNMTMEVIVK